MYKFLRNLLFLFPAEGVHYFSMNMLRLLCKWGMLKKGLAVDRLLPPRREVRAGGSERKLGLRFAEPMQPGSGFSMKMPYTWKSSEPSASDSWRSVR